MAFKPAPPKKEKGPLSLSDAVKQAAKTFSRRNPDIVYDSSRQIERISSGSLACDIATGGGWPKGRVSEIFGFEGSGKSALVYATAGLLYAQGKRSVIIDAEHSFHPGLARKAYGLVDDKTLCAVFQPQNIEEATELFQDIITRLDDLSFIAFDSTAGMLPKAHLEGEAENTVQVGLHARKIGLLLAKIKPFAHHRNIPVLFVNQLRSKIVTGTSFEVEIGTGAGMGRDEKYTVTGGHASRFFMDLRVRVDRVGALYNETGVSIITGEQERVRNGDKLRFSVIKSRVGVAMIKADGSFLLDLPDQKMGFNNDRDLLNLLKRRGRIKQSSSRFTYLKRDGTEWVNSGVKAEVSEDLFLRTPELLQDARLLLSELLRDQGKLAATLDPVRLGHDVFDSDLEEPGQIEVEENLGERVTSDEIDMDEDIMVVPTTSMRL